MKCMILSRNSSLFATRRLVEEGRKLGMKVKVIDTLRLSILIDSNHDKVLYRNIEIKHPDIVIPRIGASITAFGGCVQFQLEQMGIPMLNSSIGMFNSRDKFRSSQILSSAGLPTPKTMMLRRPSKKDMGDIDPIERKILMKKRVQQAIEMLKGPPVVVKLNKGTQGIGVVLCNSLNDVYAQVDMLWRAKEDFIIQQFIHESKGVDIRALVVGDKVIASMKRESKTGDFRSNTHQGGEVSAYTLSSEGTEIAVKAAKAVGLHVAGVDMLLSSEGFKIIEVNSSPGFEGLEKATDKNVAKAIMDSAYNIGKTNKKKINKISKIEMPRLFSTMERSQLLNWLTK